MFQNSLEFRQSHGTKTMNRSPMINDFRPNQSRSCNMCNSATCVLYCHSDLAYLCASCDATVHGDGSNLLSQWHHERVPVCSVCQYHPAAFTCKADAASLCATCDVEIHSANVLASRHERVLVQPISGHPCEPSTIYNIGKKLVADHEAHHQDLAQEFEEELINSWLLLEPETNYEQHLSYEETDHYLDLTEYDSGGENQFKDKNSSQQSVYIHQVSSGGSDSLVPEQLVGALAQHQRSLHPDPGNENSSPSQCVFVPCSDASNTKVLTAEGTSNYSNSKSPEGMSLVIPSNCTPMNREAKVLRYREKRKARKFEKSIRYAARKAYAETRPRVKGRFASRTAVELQLDQILPNADFSFGIVPSI